MFLFTGMSWQWEIWRNIITDHCGLYASNRVKLCLICEWPCETVAYMRVTMWNCALYASYHVQLWLRWCLWKQDCHYHCFYIFLDSDVTLPTLSIQFLSFVATHLNINSMRAEIHLHAYEMCLCQFGLITSSCAATGKSMYYSSSAMTNWVKIIPMAFSFAFVHIIFWGWQIGP